MNSQELISGQKDISLNELTEQLKKDLKLAGIDADYFNNINSKDDLLEKLKNFIQDILSYQPTEFDRFMYRVDVPEKEFSGILTTNFEVLVENMVFLILKREIQKLIFRRQFGQ